MHQTIIAIHKPDTNKLATVTAEMRNLGAPEVRVVDCGDHFMALEGSHRIAAAHALGIQPSLIVFSQDDMIDVREFDWFEPQNWAETTYPAGEVAGELYSPHQAVAYRF